MDSKDAVKIIHSISKENLAIAAKEYTPMFQLLENVKLQSSKLELVTIETEITS
jgi:hypothetical protein